MSSPKRPFHEVEGYVHEVSGVLQSQSSGERYFTAILQEADRYSRVVVLDLEKHNLFQCAERDRSGVKLSGVELSASRLQEISNDVPVNDRTAVSVVRRFSFEFDARPSASSAVKTLREIMKDASENQRVTVIVNMVCCLEDKESMSQGQRMRRKSVVVADAEELMLLTLWGHGLDLNFDFDLDHDLNFDFDLELGSWYKVENVSMKLHNGMVTLNSTPQTTMTRLEDCSVPKEFTEAEVETVVGEIINTDVKVERFCTRRHVLDGVDMSTLMTRCNKCQAFCKNSKTSLELRGHVTVNFESAEEKIHLDDVQIRELLHIRSGESVDSLSLAAAILAHDELRVKRWREFVIKLSFVDKNCSSATQAALLDDDEAEN